MELKGNIDDILKSAEKCDKFLMKMCKDRSKNHRNCAMPRCCGVCPKIFECDGVCSYIKNNFNK